MPAGRFVVEGLPLVPGTEVELPSEVAHQARDVLRLAVGESLTLLDGQGSEYPARVVASDRKRVHVEIGASVTARATEPAVCVVLCQGMLKAAKFEWILQKGTELGVAAFVPLLTERAVAAAEATGEAKRQRWGRIVAEALEQCGGSRLPEVRAPRPLMHLLADLPPDATALIPWEEAEAAPLVSVLRDEVQRRGTSGPIREVRLFIGPEGGFSVGEIRLAQRHGALPVTLGPRILRAETAALVAVTLTLQALGALDAPPVRSGDTDS